MDIESLKNKRVVLVTGPQRSGTTVMSKMIAQDLGWFLLDEADYKQNVDKWRGIVTKSSKVVVQCPGMLHLCTDLPADVAIIVMKRPVSDIHASQRRINWDLASERTEAEKYGADLDPATAKYQWLDKQSFDYMLHEYGSEYMRQHPLWRDERKHFTAKQTA